MSDRERNRKQLADLVSSATTHARDAVKTAPGLSESASVLIAGDVIDPEDMEGGVSCSATFDEDLTATQAGVHVASIADTVCGAIAENTGEPHELVVSEFVVAFFEALDEMVLNDPIETRVRKMVDP